MISGKCLCGDHRLLAASLDLEVLGLSLHSLLVNPALLCCLGFRGVIIVLKFSGRCGVGYRQTSLLE